MSNNIIKRTAIATAVSSALVATIANAATLPDATMTNKYAEQIKEIAADKKAPSAHMIVLKAKTSVDAVAAGTYQSSSNREITAQIEQLQDMMTVELNSLDFNAKVIGKTKILAPTLIVQATPEALAQISKDDRVAKVLPMFDREIHVAASSEYINAKPLITDGIASGKGQRVAVLDTGIDYTHEAFGGEGTVEAYLAAQADPTSVAWPQGIVQGGYDFIRDDADPIENDAANSPSTGDPTNHGTSSANSVNGIAPDVELYAYSVCGGGCPSAAQAAALEAAMDPNGDGDISDRVDVMNMSLGGEFGDTYTGGGTQYLVQRAVELGVNMVISAGNDGDNPFRIGGPSTTPNALSVGAMTHPATEVGIAEGAIAGLEGNIQPSGFGPQEAYTISGADIDLVYPEANQDGCVEFSADVDFTGKAVLIDRGSCNFTDKVLHAQAKGAEFVMIANNVDDGTPASMGGFDAAVTIKNVGINFAAGAALKAQLAAGGPATFDISVEFKATAGAVATFSSRGPSMDGLLKPEITAPGTSIDVAAAGTQTGTNPVSGTSFSGPITAGAVAMIREAHPERNAFEIKATIMNAANLNVTNEPLDINPDSELAPISMIGAGLVDVTKAVNLPVAAWVHDGKFDTKQAALSYGLVSLAETGSITKTVTVKNFSADAKTYNLRTEARYQSDIDTNAVSWDFPESVTVPAGQAINFDITMTVDPTKLPVWELENPFSADDIAARSAALTSIEFDGALVFDDASTDSDHDLHLVYHAMPKAATELSYSPEVVNNEMALVIENTGQTEITPQAESVIAVGTEKTIEEAEFNILSTTFSAFNSEACDSGVFITSSIQLRDPLTHVFQAGYRVEIDTDNNGVSDQYMQNYNDRGRQTAFPGRSRTLIGTTDGAGNDTLAWATPLYHAAGEDTITFSGCSELMNIDAAMIGEPMNFKVSVGYPSYQTGVYFETDSVTGSTVFGVQPQVQITSLETGEAVSSIMPGEKAVVSASGPFALSQGSGTNLIKVMAAEDLELPDVEAPKLVGGEFSVSEDAADGTVVGALTIEESELDLAISEYYVQSNTNIGLAVDADGQIVVADTTLLAGDTSAEMEVVAIDVRGNVSEPVMVAVSITAQVAPVVTPEPAKKSSSGSLAWLTLLVAPFAFMRRRKQK
ncbi:GlyGly-CTERM sorting domain-containing protein [Pseudoalteromonas sp. Scap03]|uniref:S8 family serine peptidase n=1 Tax=unclassified Pseudoalteromonas TaxID=194690 RepID=UPI0015BCBFA6|nr:MULTISPECIES: S8 family serine peptidase [unclassified Pseudoalteromonas]NWL14947.1 GlyGly-CTERM sorting domain-containing protein [Pseudoalteromonas sp. Scap03]QLE80080.1 S8 family serine peptidase [Pseudoalteromonas sp. Scap25]QLE88022.1 S8 family serine peptidase [Pseudoalteromonas sp. Scap06]